MMSASQARRLGRALWHGKKFVIAWMVPLLLLPLILANLNKDDNIVIINTKNPKTGEYVEKSFYRNQVAGCAYTLAVMALYWLTEAVPMAVTALVPIVFFPVLGVLSSSLTCAAYMKEAIMIFLGSLIAAAAVEESNLHQRIALKVLLLFGTSPKWLLLGFMVNTMFLSMWISNTAATALMIPIVDAVLVQLRHRTKSVSNSRRVSVISVLDLPPGSRRPSTMPTRSRGSSLVALEDPSVDQEAFTMMKRAIFLGICYAANIGGTGTLTGTTTNLILVGLVPLNSPNVDFSSWITFAVPGMLVNVLLAWLYIVLVYVRNSTEKPTSSDTDSSTPGKGDAVSKLIKRKYELLGRMTFHEHAVLWLFVALILMWFFRAPAFMTGWFHPILKHSNAKSGAHMDKFVEDSAPAIFVVILYFILPSKPRSMGTSPALMTWKATQEKVAWSVVLLLGGGFALSKGAEESGLSAVLGDWLGNLLSGQSVFVVQLITCCMALVMTEVASNATTATILLGVVITIAENLGIAPLELMLPLTLCCSFAFLLPVSSPPNAIIFEAAEMKTKDMVIPGLAMKGICLIVTLASMNTIGGLVFDLSVVKLNSNATTTFSDLLNETTTISSF